MKILNSTSQDIDEIFRLYRLATEFQKSKYIIHWPAFENDLVQREILENRQWKILINDKIACVWATTFDDPQIWLERNNDPSLYIHRIATNPEFRGHNFVEHIVTWAKEYALSNGKKYVRLDTVGENSGLIGYYTKCGFNFLGLINLQDTSGLPEHYSKAAVSLFEMKA